MKKEDISKTSKNKMSQAMGQLTSRLPQGWEVKKLGDVCDFQNGFAFQSKTFKDSGFPVIRITNIKKEKVDLSTVVKIDPADYNKDLTRYIIKNGDLLIAMSGATTGKIGIYDSKETVYLNQRVGKFNPKSSLDKSFLFNYLITKVEESLAISAGAAQPNLSTEQIKNFEIPLPPLPEQKRIVAILDKAFTAIEQAKANTEQNLENAKEVFESYLQSIDAELKPLENLVNIKTGKLNANAAVENGKYPFFTCSRQIYSINEYAFDLEAILLAGNNASGDFNVKHYKGKFNAYQRTYIITINRSNKVLYRFLYFQLLNSLKEFKIKSVGANTRFLKLGMIKDMKIPLPSLAEQKLIVQKLDTLSSQTQKLEAIYQQKLADLEELKKSLLQKAFNGELS